MKSEGTAEVNSLAISLLSYILHPFPLGSGVEAYAISIVANLVRRCCLQGSHGYRRQPVLPTHYLSTYSIILSVELPLACFGLTPGANTLFARPDSLLALGLEGLVLG